MRKAQFKVPSEVMAEFADELASRDLDNKIVGINQDEEILVEVSFERDETEVVDDLEEILEALIEDLENEEEENED